MLVEFFFTKYWANESPRRADSKHTIFSFSEFWGLESSQSVFRALPPQMFMRWWGGGLGGYLNLVWVGGYQRPPPFINEDSWSGMRVWGVDVEVWCPRTAFNHVRPAAFTVLTPISNLHLPSSRYFIFWPGFPCSTGSFGIGASRSPQSSTKQALVAYGV